MPKNLRVSVIIPTLNEQDSLQTALASAPLSELIVVDGGSSDSTAQIAEQAGAKVFKTLPSRGRQLNLGVKNSSGEVVLFLHADTTLPEGWLREIEVFFADPRNKWGCFKLSLSPSNWKSKLVSLGANLRSELFHLPYGDQALFFRRNFLYELGGVPDLDRLEDLRLVQKAAKRSKPYISKLAVQSSARRYERHGYLRTVLKHQAILARAMLLH